jgi:hypothetical protein
MIEEYSFGRLKLDGRLYTADLIIYPERVDASWWRREGHRLALVDLEEVLRYQPRLLLIGQGHSGLMQVQPEVQEEARRRGIELYVAPTRQAVREYNRRAAEGKVVAALHLTC